MICFYDLHICTSREAARFSVGANQQVLVACRVHALPVDAAAAEDVPLAAVVAEDLLTGRQIWDLLHHPSETWTRAAAEAAGYLPEYEACL